MSRKPQDPSFSDHAPSDDKVSATDAKYSAEDSYQQGCDALQGELERLHPDKPALTNFELTSVRALVSYVAHTNGLKEDVIRALVETYFGADDIQKIPQADFRRVVAYLVDLDPRMAVN